MLIFVAVDFLIIIVFIFIEMHTLQFRAVAMTRSNLVIFFKKLNYKIKLKTPYYRITLVTQFLIINSNSGTQSVTYISCTYAYENTVST